MARPPRSAYRGTKRRLRKIRLRDHLPPGALVVIAIAVLILIATVTWSMSQSPVP